MSPLRSVLCLLLKTPLGRGKVSIPSHAGRRNELIMTTSDSCYAHEEGIRNGCGFMLTMRQCGKEKGKGREGEDLLSVCKWKILRLPSPIASYSQHAQRLSVGRCFSVLGRGVDTQMQCKQGGVDVEVNVDCVLVYGTRRCVDAICGNE